MKIKTLLVAPYRGLMELALNLAGEYKELDLSMVHADLTEILPLLKQYEDEGIEMIISRGGTARLISQYCSLPVVEIPITGFDILRMHTLLKDFKVKIEMIGFPSIVEGFISVSNVMGFEIPYTVIQHEDEVESAITLAKRNGVAIIVGDNIAVKMAEKFGLQGILITSGREAVLEAFRQTSIIYGLMSKFKQRSEVSEQLLDQLAVGTARIAESGHIRYANAEFYRMIGVAPLEAGVSVFQRSAYLQKLLRLVDAGWNRREIAVTDAARKFIFKAGVVEEQEGKSYNVILSPAPSSDEDITLHYDVSKHETLLTWVIGTTDYMRKWVAKAAGELTYPLRIHGNKGAGKGTYAHALHEAGGERNRELIEVHIHRGTIKAAQGLKEILSLTDAAWYITGLEKLLPAVQRDLHGMVQNCRCPLMFGFDESLKTLSDQGKLEEKLLQWLKKKTEVDIPPLHAMADFDVIVSSLLVKYNEKYGKQIVGIRPEVIQALHNHTWPGDIMELKNVIREMVKRAEGEYVEPEALSVLQDYAARGNALQAGDVQLNLKQPLKRIIKEILHIVLEEENNNQSRAAERLGINRTTLWSKLKEEP